MSNRKLKVHFFAVADYEEEALWLQSQHKNGWKLVKAIFPCFFTFEQCNSDDVLYTINFTNLDASFDYMQTYLDAGWEYIGRRAPRRYFRKPSSQIDTEKEDKLLPDNQAKSNKLRRFLIGQMLSMGILFLCCVLQIMMIATSDQSNVKLLICWILLLAACGFFILRAMINIHKLKRK